MSGNLPESEAADIQKFQRNGLTRLSIFNITQAVAAKIHSEHDNRGEIVKTPSS